MAGGKQRGAHSLPLHKVYDYASALHITYFIYKLSAFVRTHVAWRIQHCATYQLKFILSMQVFHKMMQVIKKF